MKLSKFEIYVLRSALKNPSGISVFYFLSKKHVSPGAVHEVIISLERKNLLYFEEDSLFLTENGKNLDILKLKSTDTNGERPWRKVPESWIVPRLDPRRPYVPRQKQS